MTRSNLNEIGRMFLLRDKAIEEKDRNAFGKFYGGEQMQELLLNAWIKSYFQYQKVSTAIQNILIDNNGVYKVYVIENAFDVNDPYPAATHFVYTLALTNGKWVISERNSDVIQPVTTN